ncbi:hypothetical protein BJ875DRAFT_389028, partial [Amylocarpus encephaloides]
EHREDFKALVSLHLGLANSELCRFGEFREWKHGSFNVSLLASSSRDTSFEPRK